MTSPALSQGIPCLILLRESTEPLPPPHPRRRQRPSSSGVDWLLEAKPETPETAMLNGIRCTDSRPPSREAAPTSRTAHSTRVPSYLPRRERPADRHLLRAHAHVAQAGRGKRNLSPPSAPTPAPTAKASTCGAAAATGRSAPRTPSACGGGRCALSSVLQQSTTGV